MFMIGWCSRVFHPSFDEETARWHATSTSDDTATVLPRYLHVSVRLSSSWLLLTLSWKDLYIYIYMYICIYVYMYICIYVCMYICIYVYMYICIYVYMYICIYVYMYICIYVYMYICIYVYMYICIYVYMYICIYVYMYICIYVYMYICISGNEGQLSSHACISVSVSARKVTTSKSN